MIHFFKTERLGSRGQIILPIFSAQMSLSLFTPQQKTKVNLKTRKQALTKRASKASTPGQGEWQFVGASDARYSLINCLVVNNDLQVQLSRWWLRLLAAFVKRNLTSLTLLQYASQNSPTLLKINEGVHYFKPPGVRSANHWVERINIKY